MRTEVRTYDGTLVHLECFDLDYDEKRGTLVFRRLDGAWACIRFLHENHGLVVVAAAPQDEIMSTVARLRTAASRRAAEARIGEALKALHRFFYSNWKEETGLARFKEVKL
ncbi:hypothetical protein FDG94_gp101 [Pseudomonas phage SM1]|uniref:Uncharacterized protein n=2 Tax=Samunavirus TaxID=2560221 RepID=A0A0U3DEE6_9CAUD|nr:hypothetical protein FDG94_gp101 [Pseudomonas phage SM1]ALT58093.1 hypothetical protein SM1_0101 [Pseudomonas phage SM1]UGC97061.1 nicotinamide mononucleotide transporter [Pseudomonas phage BHU-1]UGV19980.1 nicotinamide mononucleotide transporter [Pseudomonas phage Pa BHU-15]UIW13581.1 nicotinamide mononucleotide transporter [Pseudomonas phage Pa BHU-17]